MNTIEIATAHNIVFRYELATTIQRVLAFVVDSFILFVFVMFVGNLLGSFESFAYIFITLIVAFYHLVFEVFNQGQSPGKMLVKLRVVTLKGGTPTPYDYLLRWVFRMIDILGTIGSLAIISISSSERNQRVGDILAQTTVISLQSDLGISLASLNDFTKVDNIKYPGVTRYNDDDMLFLKISLNRYVTNPNNSNKEVLLTITEKLVNDLELPKSTNSIDFLKQILAEYIVLTR